jgi:uncharacterized repeat protein (TIGR03843 family)
MALLGQILESSNAIFLVRVDDGDLQGLAIYKPGRGERPLWDFDHGTLCRREVAAYLVSQMLGWPHVPPTVLRDGPHGPGAVQLYINAEVESTYFTICDERQADLLPVALFDILINNADRKGGHLLLDHGGCLWAIDNALSFHCEAKLRTVIWEFAGQPIPEVYLADLRRLRDGLAEWGEVWHALDCLLDESEIAALHQRVEALLSAPVFPHPDPSRRQVPWPIV